MASVWRRTMVYLGLQDDPEGYEYGYDGYDVYEDDEPAAAPRRIEPAGDVAVATEPRVESTPTVRPVSREPARSPREDPPRVGAIRAVPATSARVHVVEPEGFNDAQDVGDRLKDRQPVILNLQGLGRDLQRRLIDFSSGLAYAVGGSMSRVADQVFLLTPTDVEVSDEEKERLQARGLYRA
ncbi:MAG TPA: cell division protein SepF [Acidimicrobiia bacterium]|nr:cell division protein SepF [Acidimicrobiia bacterium]